jgi:hypothetical protein
MAFFTSVTPPRFVGEPVVLEAVLPGLCGEIADKANARGWCDVSLASWDIATGPANVTPGAVGSAGKR